MFGATLTMQEMAARDKRVGKQREYCRAYYARNKERMQKRGRAYRAEHIDVVREKQKVAAYAKRSTGEQAAQRMLYRARRRAKELGVPFGLELGDIVVPDKCPIRHVTFSFSGLNHPNAPSLDRVKADLGYVVGNVRVISFKANRTKNDETDAAVFERMAAYVRGEL